MAEHRDDKAKPKGTVAERQARIAELQAEIAELERPPIVEYPKTKYHADEPPVTVESADAEKKLGAGWVDSPEDLPGAKKSSKDSKDSAGIHRAQQANTGKA